MNIQLVWSNFSQVKGCIECVAIQKVKMALTAKKKQQQEEEKKMKDNVCT